MKRLPLLLLALLLLAAPAAAGEVWEKQLGEEITAVATDDRGDRIVVGTASKQLYCYDASGNVVWHQDFSIYSGTEIGKIEVRGDYLLVLIEGDPDGRFLLRDVDTGSVSLAAYSHGFYKTPVDADLAQNGIWVATTTGYALLIISDESNTRWVYGYGYTSDSGARVGEVAISGTGEWLAASYGASDLRLYSLAIPDVRDEWLIDPYSWTHRAAHVIENPSASTMTDALVMINVTRGAGTSTGHTLYAPDCQADFGDIRFTADDSVTELPYRLYATDGNTAMFLVEIPLIPASGTTTIYTYWYYQLPSKSTTSDPSLGADLYIYDDFDDGTIDTSIWTVTTANGATAVESGGYLDLNTNGYPQTPAVATVQGPTIPAGSGALITASVKLPTTYQSSTYNYKEHFLFTASGSPGIRSYGPTLAPSTQLYWPGNWTGLLATYDSYITHQITVTPSETRWVAGSDWDETASIAATSVKLQVGDPVRMYCCGHMQIDSISITPLAAPEMHGAWGPVESIITLQDTKTLDGTIVDIDAPETGDWVAVSTTTKTYIIQVTDSGFGTVYSADRTGTPYAVAIANSGANAIEGRGILADIFRFDGVQTGTYTAGGPVQHVAIAQKNGLYAAAGSDDGKYYVFSKDAASSWYLLHASDSYDPVTALAMTWRGELLIVGRADGRLSAFQVSEQDATGTVKLNVFKDNKPYAAAPLRIEESADGTTWGAPITLTTDSYGSVALPVQWGNHYRITVGNGETGTSLQASPIKTEYVIIVPSELPVRLHLDYSTEYDPATGDIWIRYVDDEAKTNAVTFRLYRTADNALEYEETFNTIPAGGLLTNHSVSWTNSSYRVQMSAVRDGQTISNTWHQWVGADVAALPGELDDGIRLGIWFIVILFVAGLFSYLTGPQGAVVTSLFAAFLVLIGWLPLEPAVVALCVVWAFLGLLGRTSAER